MIIKNVLIDDMRNLDHVDAICRHSKGAKRFLEQMKGNFECLMMDHDLGLESEDGYQILTWALENDLVPDKVEMVTSNPVGRERMGLALINAGYTKKNPGYYVKED